MSDLNPRSVAGKRQARRAALARPTHPRSRRPGTYTWQPLGRKSTYRQGFAGDCPHALVVWHRDPWAAPRGRVPYPVQHRCNQGAHPAEVPHETEVGYVWR